MRGKKGLTGGERVEREAGKKHRTKNFFIDLVNSFLLAHFLDGGIRTETAPPKALVLLLSAGAPTSASL